MDILEGGVDNVRGNDRSIYVKYPYDKKKERISFK
jgi:hypothetical protein